MYVNFSDLPDWARQEVKNTLGQNKHPKAQVVATETVTLGPVWHDACMRYVVARNKEGRMAHAKSAYYDALLNSSPLEVAMHQGGSVGIGTGESVLEILTYPEGITLYVHPSNLAPMLDTREELSEIQAAILGMLNGLTSAGRKDAWSRYHVPVKLVEMVCQELADKGLVTINKAGSVTVTVKGKNQVQQDRQAKGFNWASSYFYKWSDCYQYQTGKVHGWAADVIREYKAKLSQ